MTPPPDPPATPPAVLPPLTVRPVVHSARRDAWLELFASLGATTLNDDPLWTEVQLDRGRVTLTALNRDAVEGEVALGFETPALTSWCPLLPLSGVRLDPFSTADFTSLRLTSQDGTELLVDDLLGGRTPAEHRGGVRTVVRAVWTTPEVEAVVRELAALGLRGGPTAGSDVLLHAEEGEVLVRATSDGRPSAGLAVVVHDGQGGHETRLLAPG